MAADYYGALVDSVAFGGVSDLALSDDGSTLYAAAATTHEIVALDAATLDVKARYPVRHHQRPALRRLRRRQGSGSATATSGTATWARSTRRRTGRRAGPRSDSSPWISRLGPGAPRHRPVRPGLLAVGATEDSSTGPMAVFDVSGATPQVVAWHNGDY